MFYTFEFRYYQRRFKQPLQTNYGMWDIREGIIIRLGDATGKLAWGEIAPIPWFGSETMWAALDFCQRLSTTITAEDILSIPDEFPACQFGFESAWESLIGKNFTTQRDENNNYSILLPTGEAGLEKLAEFAEDNIFLQKSNSSTFKWKIAVTSIDYEIKIFDKLINLLPHNAKLRLDANGGLNLSEANLWLELCDRNRVEFIEQPLSVKEFAEMLKLSEQYATPIALDESVATINQLETTYQKGWRGIFVIKPCIIGFPSRLRQFCENNQIDMVFSSVFETAIGRQAALKLASQLSPHPRALGFGINHWFAEDEKNWFEDLWNKY